MINLHPGVSQFNRPNKVETVSKEISETGGNKSC